MRLYPLALAAIVLAGCVGVPGPRESLIAARPAGPLLSATDPAFTTGEPRGDWWRLYASAQLDGLVADALAQNRSLTEAAAVLEQTRAGLREARAALLPSTTVSASARYIRQPLALGGAGFPGGGLGIPLGDLGESIETDIYTAGLEAAYELDFFGRVRSSTEAALQEAHAAEAAYQSAALMVVGETARAWSDYCAGEAQVAVAERNLRLQARSLELVRALHEAGRTTGAEATQAEAAAQAARAAVRAVSAARDGAVFRLGALTGRTPAEMTAALPACTAVPRLSAPIAVGDGAALLARRPDVRQAERLLSAAAARVGVATASLYPSVTLGAAISNVALEPSGLASSDGLSFSIGPLISWSFPNIAAARARIAQAEAGADAALARFDQAILTALAETETALAVYSAERERRSALEGAREASVETAAVARARYEAGAADLLSVLDAERALADTEAALTRADAAVASAEVALFMALGGGWDA